MAKIVQANIFDRILEGHGNFSLSDIKESVRCDLENLLNAMQGRDDLPKHYTELSKSLATYGLNGFNTANLESHGERQRLLMSIKRTINNFEPRLERVEVEDQGIIHPFILRFRITAVLRVNEFVDNISFGTTINKYGAASVKD